MDINSITDIIQDPAHGLKFYTRENLEELIRKVKAICGKLEIDGNTSPSKIISIVNDYIKFNVKLRNEYFNVFCEREGEFDIDELIYRTAYGALIKGQAVCAGFTEAIRIVLNQYGIKTYTVLTKLPGENKRLLHYVAIVEYEEDGQTKYMVLDPERQANCERKGRDFERYKAEMSYILPDPIFTKDVVGETGVGMEAQVYFGHERIFRIQGTEHLKELVERIKERTVPEKYDDDDEVK